ncbi:MAG TPA: L-histidine N(alpha)-methyltransferase [Chthonomonadaceae bacterium]|nr:L-histidine N(alpha)-methyltransferase [Chthonomonadaceae bacterium]
MPNLNLITVPASHQPETLFALVTSGLSRQQKSLPCRLFYDAAGSQLFERICALPEYYLTRTEHRILEEHAAEIVAALGDDIALVEFGSGSSCKTRLLIEAVLAWQRHLHYTPIDISRQFLHESALALQSDYEGLAITAIAAEYDDSLQALPDHHGPRLFLFLGSNIGNFTREEATGFLERIARRMQPTDRLLVGIDLMKDIRLIEAAYNDSLGVTAAFNKNILSRINREMDADFDLDRFEHQAPFIEREARIEMRLVSRRKQTVRLPAENLQFHFEAGEFIHTENSHKYTLGGFGALCASVGLEIQQTWQDERSWFAEVLLRPRL